MVGDFRVKDEQEELIGAWESTNDCIRLGSVVTSSPFPTSSQKASPYRALAGPKAFPSQAFVQNQRYTAKRGFGSHVHTRGFAERCPAPDSSPERPFTLLMNFPPSLCLKVQCVASDGYTEMPTWTSLTQIRISTYVYRSICFVSPSLASILHTI